MRKIITPFLISVFLLLLLVSPLMAAKKAGEITEGVFTDNDFNYSFKVPESWSDNIRKSTSPLRINLHQKDYPVPRDYIGGNEDYAQVPTMVIFVDTTSLSAKAFTDSLLSESFSSKQKKFFLKNMRLFGRYYEVLKRREYTFQDNLAVLLDARQQYSREIQSSSGSDKADIVNDYVGGGLFITVRDGIVFILEMEYEYQFHGTYQEVRNFLLETLKFN